MFLHPPLTPSSVAAVIYCFLSTCLGLQIRRSDVWEALTTGPSATSSRNRQSHGYGDSTNGLHWDRYESNGNEAIELMSRAPPREFF